MNYYFSHCHLISIQNGKVERAWIFIPDQDSNSFLVIQVTFLYKLTHCPDICLLYRVARTKWRCPVQCPHTHSMLVSLSSLSGLPSAWQIITGDSTAFPPVWTLEHSVDWVLLLSQFKCYFISCLLFIPSFLALFLYVFIPPSKFQLRRCVRCVLCFWVSPRWPPSYNTMWSISDKKKIYWSQLIKTRYC